jgi:hypothetical protein
VNPSSDSPSPDRADAARLLSVYFTQDDEINIHDPKSILGLNSADGLTQGNVISSMKRRLHQIARSSTHATSEADQARFIVHAAAAKILAQIARADGSVAAAGLKRDGGEVISPSQTVPHHNTSQTGRALSAEERDERYIKLVSEEVVTDLADGSGVRSSRQPLSDDVLELIRGIVLSCGGWNRTAAARIAPIAALHGLDMSVLAAQMSDLQARAARTDDSASSSLAYVSATPLSARPLSSPAPIARSVMDPAPASGARSGNVSLGPELLIPDDIPTREDNNRFVKGLALAMGGVVAIILIAAAVLVVVIRLRPPAGSVASTQPNAPAPVVTLPSPSSPSTAIADTHSATTSPGNNITASGAEVNSRTRDVTPSAQPQPEQLPEWIDLVRAMEVAGDALRTLDSEAMPSGDAEAIALFSSAYDALAYNWHSTKPDQRTSGVRAVVDALFASFNSPEVGVACFSVVTRSFTASDLTVSPPISDITLHIGSSVWSAGVLARLTQERDLPRATSRELELVVLPLRLSQDDHTFEAGARGQLIRFARNLIPTTPTLSEDAVKVQRQAWATWLTSACGLYGVKPGNFDSAPGSTRASQLILTAIDFFIPLSPAFTSDEPTNEALSALVAAVPWGPQDPTRPWLLTRFDDAATPSHVVHMITSALANRSGASGVDLTMVLAPSATADQRRGLRDTYASVWAISDTPARNQIFAEWAEQAERELNAAPDSSRPFAQAVSAAALARLNSAAWLLIEQSDDSGASERAANDIIKSPDTTLINTLASIVAPSRDGPPRDEPLTQWALEYLAAGDRTGERRELLSRAPTRPTPAEARILVEQACRSDSQSVQSQAVGLLRTLAYDGNIALAMLDFAPFIPATSANNELVRMVSGSAQIPATRDPAWRIAVRRALVQRALEVSAGGGVEQLIDNVASALNESYRDMAISAARARAPRTPKSSVSGENGDPDTTLEESVVPHVHAAALADDLTLTASSLLATGNEPRALSSVTSERTAQRRSLSQSNNLVHAFTVEQSALVQLHGYTLALRQPSTNGLVAALLDDLRTRNRSASHALTQIYNNESTITRFWLARFKPPEPAETLSPALAPPATPADRQLPTNSVGS